MSEDCSMDSHNSTNEVAVQAMARGSCKQPMHGRSPGFTLVEVLVVMTVLAILAAIAVPSYARYVTRGNLVEATNALSEYRVRMEQFYQDARSYQDAAGVCGAALPANLENFAVACVIAAGGQAYTATATGAGSMAGFVYSVNQANVRATVALPAHWSSLPPDAATRWVTR